MQQAIVVDRLSKRYVLGEANHPQMLREALMGLFTRGLRHKRQPRPHVWALENVSFDIQEGEVVGIIGRNGAGKSTLLKLLSRITAPSSGTVHVAGRLASLLEVGTGFHEEMTGRENIYLNGSILGMRKREIDAKLDEIIEFSGVEQFIDTPIKRYSTGMKLRLGFAVAAHLEPEILLVDEVLAVGDAQFQKKCLAKMGDMQSGGRTVLFVSHNLAAVENLCSRTIWIDQGRVRRDGPSSQVIREYLGCFAQNHQTHLDLSQTSGRRGSGPCRITGATLLDQDRHPKDVIRSGDALTLRIAYRATERSPEPHFGFRLATDSGRLLTDISTWSLGMDTPYLEPGEGTIDFEIDFLNLMPGEYLLSLWWIQGAGTGPYDIVDDCMRLQVHSSDYYQSGRGIDSKFGLIFFPGRWQAPVQSHVSEEFSAESQGAALDALLIQ